MIPIDFVAGSHGHFLEVVLNIFFGITPNDFVPFNSKGASHNVTPYYQHNRMFVANHWYELYPDKVKNFDKVISIRFDTDDLLLLSSISLLRAGDVGINNDDLEVDTFNKLNNRFYSGLIEELHTSYPFLKSGGINVPRNVLREFFKFGFRDPTHNGYWKKQQQMTYTNSSCVFRFKSFYDYELFVENLREVEAFVELPFSYCEELESLHRNFLELNPFRHHATQCDEIIEAVQQGIEIPIPKLTLFQESYINGRLELIYQKEMPFHDVTYFTSTKDMLKYIETRAPNL